MCFLQMLQNASIGNCKASPGMVGGASGDFRRFQATKAAEPPAPAAAQQRGAAARDGDAD